jgi:hypothetical protein
MKLDKYIFSLNNTEKIIIRSQLEDVIHCCYEASIFLCQDTEEILLSIDSVRMNMGWFSEALNKALSNNLQLHASITQDIGFLFNRDRNEEKPDLAYEKIERVNFWVGDKYKLWSYRVATWLYNDQAGNIILEITPIYPKTFRDPAKDLDIDDYEAWMKTYEPMLIRTISVDTARTWLAQANDILKQIEENIKMLQEKNQF